MSFDERTARAGDSPKARVKAVNPDAECTAVYWNGRLEGYVVEVGDNLIGTGRSAWDAWRSAEARAALTHATREAAEDGAGERRKV